MINKSNLQSIISKYYLNAMNEAVKWNIKDNKLNIKFSSLNKEMLGEIEYNGFPLKNSIIAINNTTQLNKLISITNNELDIKYLEQNGFINKLIIADNQFTLNYSLADPLIIPKVGEVNDIKEWNITSELNLDIINSLIKAKNALVDNDTVIIKPYTNDDGELLIEFQFGGDIEYTNKVSFFINDYTLNNCNNFTFNEYYNSDIIKEILSCNKDMDKGIISINLDGILKIEFFKENLKSIYYIVSKNK